MTLHKFITPALTFVLMLIALISLNSYVMFQRNKLAIVLAKKILLAVIILVYKQV